MEGLHRRTTAMEQLPLFECEPPQPLPRARNGRRTSQAQWTRYTSRERAQCDDCVLVAHQMWPEPAPPIRRARWMRLSRHGKRLLCSEHARHWAGGSVE